MTSVPNNADNILIVRQHNQLGDMLCSVPLFAAIRKRFPNANITLVASPINYEILYSEINPYINEVIVFNKSTAKHILRFFRELRAKKFDIGIVPSTVAISRTSHFINYISGAKVRAGASSINGKKNKVDYLLNVRADFNWDEKKMHQTERNLDIGRLIGCDLSEQEKKNVHIRLSSEETDFAEKYFEKMFPDRSKFTAGFHPGAGKIPNRWDSEKFVSLIKEIHGKYGCYILITSGSIDREVTDIISRRLTELDIPFKVLDETPIRKVAAVIRNCGVYVTNDTGTMHVASYVDSAVIGLFGPTNGFEWGPINDNGSYIQSPSRDINDIKVETVLEAVSGIFENKSKNA